MNLKFPLKDIPYVTMAKVGGDGRICATIANRFLNQRFFLFYISSYQRKQRLDSAALTYQPVFVVYFPVTNQLRP